MNGQKHLVNFSTSYFEVNFSTFSLTEKSENKNDTIQRQVLGMSTSKLHIDSNHKRVVRILCHSFSITGKLWKLTLRFSVEKKMFFGILTSYLHSHSNLMLQRTFNLWWQRWKIKMNVFWLWLTEAVTVERISWKWFEAIVSYGHCIWAIQAHAMYRSKCNSWTI